MVYSAALIHTFCLVVTSDLSTVYSSCPDGGTLRSFATQLHLMSSYKVFACKAYGEWLK